MKRLAIPIENDLLSPYFGKCSYYLFVDINEDDGVVTQRMELPSVKSIEDFPKWLSDNNITDIVAHRMNGDLLKKFTGFKINVFLGIPIDGSEKIIDDYKKGTLRSDRDLIQEIIEK